MLRSIYRWLVRCHPPCFRMRFGEQMLSFFDQIAGTTARVALIADGLISVLRQWSLRSKYRQRQQTGGLAIAVGTGPAFQTLNPYRPRTSTLVNGVILTGIGFCLLCLALRYNWTHPVLIPFNGIQFAPSADQRLSSTTAAILPTEVDEPKYSKREPSSAAVTSNRGPESSSSQATPRHVENATRAMIQAMTTHQIVMFGETHGNKQEYEWLCSLVKDSHFARHVDDIVVEFGNSLYQKSVDRYIAGEDVPWQRVEKAWRNMIGAVGPISPVYGWFYKAVRESNLQSRGGHKIRLLLGDPYGDWDKINNAEDLGPYLGHRDEWYAQVVKEEVLVRNRRALLIMGAGHFLRREGLGVVENAIRATGVEPYLVVFGTNAIGGYDDLDPRFDAWPLPAIVALSGNWVGELPAMPVLTGGQIAPNSLKMADVADAMLYVGSRDALTQVFVPRSELIDTAYGKEVERRLRIQTGHTMDFTEESEGPQYHKPLQQRVSNGVHRLPPNPPKRFSNPLPQRPPSQ